MLQEVAVHLQQTPITAVLCVASKLHATALGCNHKAHPQCIACLELLRNLLLGGRAWRQDRFDMGDYNCETPQRRLRMLGIDELRQTVQFCHEPFWR
jgi:hypothetical protein